MGVKQKPMADLTRISHKALEAPWVGASAGWSPRYARSSAQQHFSFHFTMAEVGNAPLPPRSSNFQQSVQCLRDASVHPDEETIELPDSSTSSYYCRHASLPHNQLTPHRLHDATCRDELQAAHTDKAQRNIRGMLVHEQDKHRMHPGMPRFVNGSAMRSPMNSVSRRVGAHHGAAAGPEGASLCSWAYGQQWLDHKGSYCTETKDNTLLGVLDNRRQMQLEADEVWINQSEKLHGQTA